MLKKIFFLFLAVTMTFVASCNKSEKGVSAKGVKYVGSNAPATAEKSKQVAPPDEPQISADHKGALDAINKGELSFLGAHVCLRPNGSFWQCEAASPVNDNAYRAKDYNGDPSTIKILLIIHDNADPGSYSLNGVPLIDRNNGKELWLPYSKQVNTRVYPVEYNNQNLYVMEPDMSSFTRNPDTYYYFFALKPSGNQVLKPGFSFR